MPLAGYKTSLSISWLRPSTDDRAALNGTPPVPKRDPDGNESELNINIVVILHSLSINESQLSVNYQ